ncbi:MAG: 2-oxoacid:acceptor oxidoreductase subunit alpha, partial [Anaerolineales bacterium]
MTVQLMQGNEAIGWGAIAAGCRFYAGYPITPSTEVAEILSRELPKVGGKFIQMEDEIASMAAIIGARLGGLKSMTATSGPGFSLMQENIGYAAIAEIPCVVVDVQRLGPSTGQPTAPSQGDVMQARWGTHGDHPIIALAPVSVRQAFDLTVTAFDMSERYRTPVILLTDEVVGHMREPVELPDFSTISVFEHRVNEPPQEYKAFRNTADGVPPLV